MSLRAAVLVANLSPGDNTITFAVNGTIALAQGELKLTDTTGSTTIQGPGVGNLTIDAQNASRIFFIDGKVTAQISGLTMQKGNGVGGLVIGSGGGILNLGGTLTLTNAAILNCRVTTPATVTAAPGGGIFSLGRLTVNNCTITGNTALSGGGIASTSEDLISISNSTFSGNQATNGDGGGIRNTGGNLSVFNSTFFDNSATGAGGGIDYTDVRKDLVVRNSTFTSNTAANGGGIFAVPVSDLSERKVRLVSNTIVSGNNGGDLFGTTFTQNNNLIGGNASTILNLSAGLGNFGGPTRTISLAPNSPGIGAGTFVKDSSPPTDQRGFLRPATPSIGAFEPGGNILVTTLVDEDNGSADPNQGTGTSLREAVVLANQSREDTTIAFASNLTGTIKLTRGFLQLSNSFQVVIQGPGFGKLTIDGNNADRIFHVTALANAAISGLTLTRGRAGDSLGGGAIFNEGRLILSNDVITSNTATEGGGITNTGALTLSRATVDHNEAEGSGGGIVNEAGGVLTVVNSTIAFNIAIGFGGGGIGNFGTLTVINSTIAGNLGNLGGGIFTDEFDPGATTTLFNTLVAGNTATSGPDLIGRTAEAASANNLIGDANASFFIPSGNDNIVGVTLATVLQTNQSGAVVLANNGGRTPTIALIGGSPAVNAGDSSRATSNGQVGSTSLSADQRGFARISGTSVDIGAFEAALTLTAPSTSNTATPTVTVHAGPGFANGTTVTLAVDQNSNFTTSTLTNGTTTFQLPTLTAGSHTLTASITDSNNRVWLSRAVTLVVNTSASGSAFEVTPQTIQGVISNLASAGDTLRLSPGNYAGITINQGMTLDGQGGDVTFTGASPALTITSGTVLVQNGVTFTNDTDAPSIVVQNGSQLTLRDCIIQESTGFNQAAIAVEAGGVLDLGTSGDPGNNIVNINGAGSFFNNQTGSAIPSVGTTFQLDGGAIPTDLVVDSAIDDSDGNFTTGNLSLREAVQLANLRPGPDTITFSLSTITLTGTELALTDTTTITGEPGASATGDLGEPGASATGGVVIQRSSAVDGRLFSIAGGVTAAFDQLTFANGFTTGLGGAILNDGTLTVSNSTFTGNKSFDQGGALANRGTLTLVQCTLSGNESTGNRGGGLVNQGTATLIHCTVASNAGIDDGGGIRTDGPLTLINSIVAGNTAQAFGDIFVGGNTLTIEGVNIVPDLGLDGSANPIAGGGSISTADPLLGPLADNGGPTPTRALLVGSPAINGGIAFGSPPSNDQRGFARADGAVDIGAFELILHFNSPSGSNLNTVRGQALNFAVVAQFTPSASDSLEQFTASIDWGDNTAASTADRVFPQDDGSVLVLASHTYDFAGNFTIQVTLRHTDGSTTVAQSSAAVTIVALEPDINRLRIGGTPNDDTILIEPTDLFGTVRVTVNGADQGTFRPTFIVADGYAGNDTLRLAKVKIGRKNVTVTALATLNGGADNDILDAKGSSGTNVLIGSAGNDTLTGGSKGANVLIGNDGNDRLTGGSGRDILFGGLGADILNGGAGDNILVGDRFSPGEVIDNALALLNVWTQPSKFKDRMNALASQFNDQTLEPDEVDQLFGGPGKDWFVTRNSTNRDRVIGKGTGDVVTKLA